MRDISEVTGFHFHVYYSDNNRENAKEIFRHFPTAHWYDKPIGPHTQPMFAIEVPPSSSRGIPHLDMEDVYKFMILNRNGLSVLMHPITENELEAHTTLAIWLGTPIPLDLDKL